MSAIAGEVSSWDKDDPKVYRIHYFAKEVARHLEDESLRDEVEFFADRLSEKLDSALMYYQMITDNDFDKKNISQRRTIYEGLYANLWAFYKGRMQRYLKEMGWKLDFLFCKEDNFKKLSKRFIEQNPTHKGMVEFAKQQRLAWQSNFGHGRNVAEHSGDYRDGTAFYDNPNDAKRLFNQVCYTAETVIAYFGSWKMDKDWNVIERHKNAFIFDDVARFEVEHAMVTSLAKNRAEKNGK